MNKIKQYLELIIDIMLVVILTAWIVSIIQDCCRLNNQKQTIIIKQEKIIGKKKGYVDNDYKIIESAKINYQQNYQG